MSEWYDQVPSQMGKVGTVTLAQSTYVGIGSATGVRVYTYKLFYFRPRRFLACEQGAACFPPQERAQLVQIHFLSSFSRPLPLPQSSHQPMPPHTNLSTLFYPSETTICRLAHSIRDGAHPPMMACREGGKKKGGKDPKAKQFTFCHRQTDRRERAGAYRK